MQQSRSQLEKGLQVYSSVEHFPDTFIMSHSTASHIHKMLFRRSRYQQVQSELMFCFTMTNNYSHVLVYIGAELSMAFHYLLSLLRAEQFFCDPSGDY